jgi:hypothetical protein
MAYAKQFLGYTHALIRNAAGTERRRVPIFAIWFDDPESSLAAQFPATLACPACGHPLALSRLKSDRTFTQPHIVSTAIGCGACGATIHFDKTPQDRRASLTWTKRFEQR